MTVSEVGIKTSDLKPLLVESQMLIGLRDVPDHRQDQHILDCIQHAVQIILAWPCPACGGRYPCPCDNAPLVDVDRALLDR